MTESKLAIWVQLSAKHLRFMDCPRRNHDPHLFLLELCIAPHDMYLPAIKIKS